MRSIAAKLFVGMALTAIGMFGADSTLGTWKFNAAKSKTAAGFQIKQQTDVRVATPDGSVKVTRTGQMADGTAVNFSFTYKYDGKKYPVTGGPFDTLSVKRNGCEHRDLGSIQIRRQVPCQGHHGHLRRRQDDDADCIRHRCRGQALGDDTGLRQAIASLRGVISGPGYPAAFPR